MDKETYILNEVGIEMAKEKLAIKFRKLLDDQEKSTKEKKEEMLQMIRDKEEIENGNNQIIKKYVGEIDCE